MFYRIVKNNLCLNLKFSCDNSDDNILVLSVMAKAENILVDSGQSLTLTCNYRGIYVDINKEVKTNSEQRTQLLYLRVNNQQPNRIGDAGRPWKYNPTKSFYGRDADIPFFTRKFFIRFGIKS